MRATTILAVRQDGTTAMAGDGQVTMGDTIMKQSAMKIRRLYGGRVLVGFAGAVADALTLLERFERQLERASGDVRRAAVDLAKDWRTDRFLRPLEAQLILAGPDALLLVSGDGEIIEPDNDILAIGSGGTYALAAARALLLHTDLGASDVVKEALEIASSICIYTNQDITVEVVDGSPVTSAEGGESV